MWRRAPRCPRAGASGMTATSCCTGRTVWTSSRRRCARATDPRASSRPLGAAPAAARGETRLAASVAPGVSDLSRAAADDARGNVGEIHPEAPGRRAAPEARDDGSRGARVLHRVRLHALAQSGPPAPQRVAARPLDDARDARRADGIRLRHRAGHHVLRAAEATVAVSRRGSGGGEVAADPAGAGRRAALELRRESLAQRSGPRDRGTARGDVRIPLPRVGVGLGARRLPRVEAAMKFSLTAPIHFIALATVLVLLIMRGMWNVNDADLYIWLLLAIATRP